MRFGIAIVYGTTLGIRNVQGSLLILNAINLITFIPYMYCRYYLNANMESYQQPNTTTTTNSNSNHPPLLFVGVLPALAMTLLIWIYYFTLRHEMEIEILSPYLLLRDGDDTNVNMTSFGWSNNNNNDNYNIHPITSMSDDPNIVEVQLNEEMEF
jgi:hypothetical protein